VTTLSYAYASFDVEYAETIWYPKYSLTLRAPMILPELKYISSITLSDERYHGFKFCANNLDDLRRLLSHSGGVVMIKQKAGCLPYDQDPLGYRSLMANCLSRDSSFQWHSAGSVLIGNFSSDPSVKAFSTVFLQQGKNHKEFKKMLNQALYECASHEKMELLMFWIEMFDLIGSTEKKLVGLENRQLATFLTLVQRGSDEGYVSPDLSSSVLQTVVRTLNSWTEASLAVQSLPDLSMVHFSKRTEMSKVAAIATILFSGECCLDGQKKNPLTSFKKSRQTSCDYFSSIKL
jgi:hypothetical protein